MRDPAGKSADTFEALGAQKVRFKFLLLGHVSVDEEDGARFAIGTANKCSAAISYYSPAILCDLSEFTMEFAGGR